MSIVICVVENDKTFYLASDKRAIKNGIINDNYKKIYELKTHIYFAMTGIAEVGLSFLEVIKNNIDQPIKEFLKEVDSKFPTGRTKLTVTIAGLDENNIFFIWQKNNSGMITNAKIGPNIISYSISSNDNMELFDNYFRDCVNSVRSVQYCIADTIKYASEIDNSISSGYDLIIFGK
jgi:20S proteasome alpha/beta subunit